MVGDGVGEGCGAREGGRATIGGTVEDPAVGSDGIVKVRSAGGAVAKLPRRAGGPRLESFENGGKKANGR